MQRGPVQALLVPPVGVPHERLRRHGGDEDRRRQQHRPAARPRAVSPRYPVASGDRGADHQTGAHAGQVQYPFGYHEAHVEEQIARRQEGEHEEAQGYGDGGGRRLPAADAGCAATAAVVRPLGTMTITERAVVVVVGRPAAVRVTAARASARAHGTPGGRGARIRLEQPDRRRGRRRRLPAARPSQAAHRPESGGDQSDVQAHRLEIPRVQRARYSRHGVHRPVEAQGAGAQQHSRARRRQIEEREAARQARRMPRRWIVRAGKLRPDTREPDPAQREQRQTARQNADAATPGESAVALKSKRFAGMTLLV